MIENPREFKNELLKKLDSKTITQEEFNSEIAYWYMNCFKEIYPRALPTMPDRYKNYNQMDEQDKKEVPNSFWLLPDIKHYMDTKQMIINENKAMLFHLKEYLPLIPQGDFVGRANYKEKINEFESS